MRTSRSPLKAIRRNCLDCSGGSSKYVMWCPCDGVHSTWCHLWPFRFGLRLGTAQQRYGAGLVMPEMMPGANVTLDDLPGSLQATEYLDGQVGKSKSRAG